MNTSTMQVIVAIPKSLTSTSELRRRPQRILVCHWQVAGIVWRGLKPLLLHSKPKTARRALQSLLRVVQFTPVTSEPNDEDDTMTDLSRMAFSRTLQLQPQHSSTPNKDYDSPILLLWIQPPGITHYDTSFTGRLIAWEHQTIRYQSLAAWVSTLGGGHFFCRHLKTAVALAQQQRQIAFLMGDYNMAYKCTINESYSYIYAGFFTKAIQTIDSIPLLNRRWDIHPLDTVILNMMQSAKLFCKRMRKASRKLKTNPTKKPALTFDDYQRIRIVEEQSSVTTFKERRAY